MPKQKQPEAAQADPKSADERPEFASNEEQLEPMPAALPEPAAPARTAEWHTPAGWAERLGMIVKADPRMPQQETHAKPEHAAADALYGWTQHAYHYQAPGDAFFFDEATYHAALRSAMEHPVAPLVDAAIPPSQRARLSTFKPKAAANR